MRRAVGEYSRRTRAANDEHRQRIQTAREALEKQVERLVASCDTHPKGGDSEAAPFMSGAVPSEETADAQKDPS